MYNHFRICLPHSVEELDSRVAAKGRYNLRRDLRLLNEIVGKCEFTHVLATDNVAEKYVEFYFEMKCKGYNYQYESTWKDYIDSHFVTDIYAIENEETGRIVSVLFTCEQCPIVYLENLTYDYDLARYSPGAVLYDYVLKQLVVNGKEQVFLLGGEFSYKKRYGSIEETVHYGKLIRPSVLFKQKTKMLLKKLHLC